ncbi:hypothetical protein BDQ94DRAFT_91822 [Aspergillus welwitschiae]|uniref:Uncharacterized protein n=1 Tax=Aspergillus welwitschiae TaxID=1341132 RepID=A0A3F3QG48_9EURO|nr:hypothetical protein BDQ94DRAFT_91822 [Aspergillus welwitschiae]RDH37646.1 hypothetical protein BDQ94DRAFT_91822 [Aspergillus welwitschiae]
MPVYPYYDISPSDCPLHIRAGCNSSASFATATASVLCTASTACRHNAGQSLTRMNSAPHTSAAQPSASSLLHPDPKILAAFRSCGALIPYVSVAKQSAQQNLPDIPPSIACQSREARITHF